MNEIDIKEWLVMSSHDTDTAQLLIKEKGHADVIIYHVHQAIEKSLKALMIKSNKPLEKTHFLDKLLSILLTDYPDLSSVKDEILEINLYLPKLRYPSGEKIEFQEAVDIYNKLIRVNTIIQKLV